MLTYEVIVFQKKFAYILNELSLILHLLITGMQRHFNTNTFWCQFSVVSQLLFFRFFFYVFPGFIKISPQLLFFQNYFCYLTSSFALFFSTNFCNAALLIDFGILQILTQMSR